MARFALLSVSVVSLAMAGPALPQEPPANRFTMEKTENGFVRMDSLTGEMSVCTEKAGQLVCRMAADERRAFQDTLSVLSARVADLERRLDAMPPAAGRGELGDDAELDRALGAMEKMMRRFFGMVEELRRDFDFKPEVPSVPDRT